MQYLALDRQAERGRHSCRCSATAGSTAYDPEFVRYCRELFPVAQQHGVRLITNGGGEDAEAALQLAARHRTAAGLDGYSIAATTNVDALNVVTRLDPIVLETGAAAVARSSGEILGVTPYFGARQIVDAWPAAPTP